MILPDLILPSRANQKWDTSGIDSIECCFNKQHFLDYPHTVDYQYNSRGFRDSEWPDSFDDLQNAIWCIGDSFTVGIGSPYAFTWSQVLSKATNRRCINISMDGASNTWIARRAHQIIQDVNPTHIVVLWSYIHRRESPDSHLPDDLRIMFDDKSSLVRDDLKDFINCYNKVSSCATSTNTSVFNAAVPNYIPENFGDTDGKITHIIQSWANIKDSTWGDPPRDKDEFDILPNHIKNDVYVHAPDLPKDIEQYGFWYKFRQQNQLLQLINLDHARDYHHFDKITSEFFVQEICKNITALPIG
jgi:hypothetical protein